MRAFEAVIFDMDGTLIEPLLDMSAVRRELGIDPRVGVLQAIAEMPPELRRRANMLLLEREMDAARRALLMPAAAEVVRGLRRAGIKLGLLTNNHQAAMETVLGRFGLEFDLAWSRENGPVKPDPRAVLGPCRTLGATPARTAVVGDFLYDIQAARGAGAVSVLLAQAPRPAFADEADYVIESLLELPALLGIRERV